MKSKAIRTSNVGVVSNRLKPYLLRRLDSRCGCDLGRGYLFPRAGECDEQLLDFGQRFFDLSEISFPESVLHVSVKIRKRPAHLAAPGVVESLCKFLQDLHHPGDGTRSLPDSTLLQMLARFFCYLNRAVVCQTD